MIPKSALTVSTSDKCSQCGNKFKEVRQCMVITCDATPDNKEAASHHHAKTAEAELGRQEFCK